MSDKTNLRREEIMKRFLASLLVTTAIGLSWFPVAYADAVTDWNEIAVDTILAATPPRPGPVPFLDLAVVHAAIYDAVSAIGGKYKPYKVEIPVAAGSPEGATAKAARDVLISIFPDKSDSIDTTYRGYLVKQGIAENDPGIAVGEKAAAGIVTVHASNVRVPVSPEPFRGDTKPGMWRPTKSYQEGPPPSDSSMAAPWLGGVTPFTLKSGDQFRAKPPPTLTSEEYTKAYNEVKDLGSFSNSKRNEKQEELAHFYAGNTVKLYSSILREVAEKNVEKKDGYKIDDTARLMALATMSVADTLIGCWDNKKHYALWRPITAIQEGENDGNPNTVGDPNWQPFLNTPPYPDYTSGANSVHGSTMRALSLFFGKDVPFTVTSVNPKLNKKTREYKTFSEMADDIVDVRIYHGLHFRFADVAAREQGTKVAEWVFSNVGAKK
jgi:hypothetical protein